MTETQEQQAERLEGLAMLYLNDASILTGQRADRARQVAEDIQAGAAALRASQVQTERMPRRACECLTPDPVMQADMKFYCHSCSYETGARPSLLNPEEWLMRAKTAETELAVLRSAPCSDNRTSRRSLRRAK